MKNYVEKIGIFGVYLFALSTMISKSGINIGLVLMILSSVFYIKNIKFDKIEKEQKILLITLVGIVILGLFSDGGIKSAEISLKKSYRYLPIFFAPIFLNNMQKIKKFMFFISCSVIVSFINGINLYRLKDWNFNIRYESFTRINDTPHMLTALSFIILGYLLYLYHKKNGKKMIYFSLIYILMLIPILLSQTRGSWLALLMGMVVFGIILDWKKFFIIIGILGFLMIPISKTNYYKNNSYIKRFQSIKNIKSDSPKIRLILWQGCVEIYKENPIFGVGRDNLPKHMLKYLEENKKYDEVQNRYMLKEIAIAGNPHSMYFSTLVEEGIGAFLLFYFWSYVLFSEFLFMRKSKDEKFIYYILLGCVVVTLSLYISGLTENAWRSFWRGNIYCVVYIIYLSIKRNNYKIKEG